MLNFKTKIFFFLAFICLLCRSIPALELSHGENFLMAHAQFLVSHHDNIDEVDQLHTHKHKHGDDGEEHEHHHEHRKIAQTEMRVLRVIYKLVGRAEIKVGSENGFHEKTLLSTAHLFRIFRPPIV